MDTFQEQNEHIAFAHNLHTAYCLLLPILSTMSDNSIDNHVRAFKEFFGSNIGEHYKEKIGQCISDRKFRVVVNINDLRNFSRDLATRFIIYIFHFRK